MGSNQVVQRTPAGHVAGGLRVFFVGDSFHAFVVRPLIALAREAGIPGHWAEGWDILDVSTPIAHWERVAPEGSATTALQSGRVEVLTLAAVDRDPGIDLFADLAVAHNDGVRIMVQRSWPRDDGWPPGSITADDRDRATLTDIEVLRAAWAPATERLRVQLRGVNERYERELAHLVPAHDAVLAVRRAVAEGHLPGVARQSELFVDPTGHAADVVQHLVSYVWFTALYRQSPLGSSVLDTERTADSADRHLRLQQIALEAVLAEPMSGVLAD